MALWKPCVRRAWKGQDSKSSILVLVRIHLVGHSTQELTDAVCKLVNKSPEVVGHVCRGNIRKFTVDYRRILLGPFY
jgi:hypothetical protein